MQTLIEAAQAGCEESFWELFQHYRPIVYRLQQKYFLRDFDKDDWEQEGMITFHQVLLRFDYTQGTTLGLFFKRAFENHVVSLVRKQYAFKRRIGLHSVSLEEKVQGDGLESLMCQDAYYEQPLTQILIQESFETSYTTLFSSLESQIMHAYLLGADLAEIATKEALSLKTVRSAYDRAKRKLSQQIHKNIINEK